MQQLEAMNDVAEEMFHAAYVQAQRLILEHNDLDGAIACLNETVPESQPDLWQWSDLMAALLLRQGRYCACYSILAYYDARYPGDPRTTSSIRKLKQRHPEIGTGNACTLDECDQAVPAIAARCPLTSCPDN